MSNFLSDVEPRRTVVYGGILFTILLVAWLLFATIFSSSEVQDWLGRVVAPKLLGREIHYMDLYVSAIENSLARGVQWVVFFPFALILAKKVQVKNLLTYHNTNLIYGILGLAMALLVLRGIIENGNGVIASERYFFMNDDPMISLRFARNFADGYGLVWNIGQRVEGYSNFLWTLWMSTPFFIGVPYKLAPLFPMLSNALLAFVLVIQTAFLASEIGGKYTGILSAFFPALLSPLVDYSSTGWETTLQALLVVISVRSILRDNRERRARWPTYFFPILLGLVRADGLVLTASLVVFALLLSPDYRRSLRYIDLFSFILVAQFIWRWSYYGEWLPNTYYLKVTNWAGRFDNGLEYTLQFVLGYAPVLLFSSLPVVNACVFLWRQWIISGKGAIRQLLEMHVSRIVYVGLAAIVLMNAAYMFYVGGDFFPGYRFMLPCIPLIFILTSTGLEYLWQKRYSFISGTAFILMLIWLPLAKPTDLLRFPTVLGDSQSYYSGLVRVALTIRQNTTPNALVAVDTAGVIGYYLDRECVDVLGKSDYHIARVEATKNGRPGHNKVDYDYVLQTRMADVVVASGAVVSDMESAALPSLQQSGIPGNGFLFANGAFNDLYRQNRIPFVPRGWQGLLFVRSPSIGNTVIDPSYWIETK